MGKNLGLILGTQNERVKSANNQLSSIGEYWYSNALSGVHGFSSDSDWAKFSLQTFNILVELVPIAESAMNGNHHWSGLVRYQFSVSKIWLFKFSEALMHSHKVVSQFLICILKVNAGYKSVRLGVRAILSLQSDLPGPFLLERWVICPCWGSGTFGKAISCKVTRLAAVETQLSVLLAGTFGWGERQLAYSQLYRLFLG